MDRAWIVIGLGNPGARYAATRHNIGFWALDRLAERRGARFSLTVELGRLGWIARVELAGAPLVLLKPRTYMNRVGRAAAAALERYGVGVERLLVVCDDADLELGRVRVRGAGSGGGHNGLRSLIDTLHTQELARVKLGVRGAERASAELADYVLEPFGAAEREVAERLAELGADAVEVVLAEGVNAAISRCNGLRADAPRARSDEP